MLEFLRIRDLALIEDMELEFSRGLNVLTGETGAGKSFILKALGFLMGDKLTPAMVRPGCAKAQVEGIFWQGDEEILLRRELMAETGRSRLYINDHLSSQDSLKELRSALLVHTSQHGQQKLLIPAWQALLVDACIPDASLLEERDALRKALLELSHKHDEIKDKFQTLSDKRDVLEMQQQEIDKVAPEPDEEDRLEAQREEIRRASTQAEQYTDALLLLQGEEQGLEDQLGKLERVLESLSENDEDISPFLDEVSALRQSLPALERHLRRAPDARPEGDLDAIEARLYALAQLKRKLRRPLDAIVRLREEIAQNLSFLDECSLDLRQLDKEKAHLVAKLRACMDKLLPMRRAAGAAFCEKLQQELQGLGFSQEAKVVIEYTSVELVDDIIDERPRMLWAPNPGQPPQPLDKIASGGELSRFLLALVSMQETDESATYIFDEVDAGVGGITLQQVAARLQNLAQRRQMLLITHWPQLAALASRHFYIVKEEREGATYTQCVPLNEAERAAELSRMMGGGAQGEAVARSLLDIM